VLRSASPFGCHQKGTKCHVTLSMGYIVVVFHEEVQPESQHSTPVLLSLLLPVRSARGGAGCLAGEPGAASMLGLG
jgi:hypothetical protein